MTTLLLPPFHLIAHERIDSTNDELARLIAAGAGRHGIVVSAEEQTAGRGRRRRSWYSPRGNLHCSILLEQGDPAHAPELAFVAAISLRAALETLVPAAAFRCKWPNDILCDGRKVAGMLLEGAMPWTILGVGVNVVHEPEEPAYPATALAGLASALTSSEVLAEFCAHLGRWYEVWREQGFAPIRAEWLEHAAGLDQDIVARLADGVVRTGRFAGLDEDGALLLDDLNHRHRIMAGDVFFAGMEASHAAGH